MRSRCFASYVLVRGLGETQGLRPRSSPLVSALSWHFFDCAELLVAVRANLDAPDPMMRLTPLMFAAENEDIPVLQWLLARKADVNAGVAVFFFLPFLHITFPQHVPLFFFSLEFVCYQYIFLAQRLAQSDLGRRATSPSSGF